MEQGWLVENLPDELVIFHVVPHLSYDDVESVIANIRPERHRLAIALRRILNHRLDDYTRIIKEAIEVQREAGSAVAEVLPPRTPFNISSRECAALAAVLFKKELWENPGGNVLDHIPYVLRKSIRRHAYELLTMLSKSAAFNHHQRDFLYGHIDWPGLSHIDRRRLALNESNNYIEPPRDLTVEEAVDVFCDSFRRTVNPRISHGATLVSGLDYLATHACEYMAFNAIIRSNVISSRALAEFVPMTRRWLKEESATILAQQVCADGDYDSLRARILQEGADIKLVEPAVNWVKAVLSGAKEYPRADRHITFRTYYFCYAVRFDPDNEAYYRRLFFDDAAGYIDDTPKMFQMFGTICAAVRFALVKYSDLRPDDYVVLLAPWDAFFNTNNVMARSHDNNIPGDTALELTKLLSHYGNNYADDSGEIYAVADHIFSRVQNVRLSIYDVIDANPVTFMFAPHARHSYWIFRNILSMVRNWPAHARKDCGALRSVLAVCYNEVGLNVDDIYSHYYLMRSVWPHFTADDFTGPERAEYRLFFRTVLTAAYFTADFYLIPFLDCARDLSSPILLVLEDEAVMWLDAFWPVKTRFFDIIEEWIQSGIIPQEKAARMREWCVTQRRYDEDRRAELELTEEMPLY